MNQEDGKDEDQAPSAFSSPATVKGKVRRQRRLESSLPGSSEQMRSQSGEGQAPPAKPAAADAPTLLPAPYILKGELGRGGMGIVYRAFDPARNTDVAFKILPDGGAESQVTRRFQREGNELAAMSHPNIVAFYGAGSHEGRDYLIMELVEGGNLHNAIRALGGKLTPVDAAHLFGQIAEGLAHIHDQGLVHRDFKPENILLTREGVPKITDFGLARRMEERSRLTSAGAIIGTYSYLAPEQIISSDVGPPADIYAYGCCLYEALAGRPIFIAETEFALLNSHLREVPVSLRSLDPTIPAELDNLVHKLIKKAPEERPESAHEVAKALRAFIAKQVPSAPSGGEWSGTIGRQDVIAQLEKICLADAAGVSCLLSAANGAGRSVVVRELVASLRAKGVKIFSAVPQYGVQLPLREVYAGLGGDLDRFSRRLHYGGVRAAVLALREALANFPQAAIIVADDFSRMGATTNQMLQYLATLAPPPGKGWLLSCASARASSINLWEGAQRVDMPVLAADKVVFLAEKELGGPLEKGLQDWLMTRAAGSVRRLRLNLYALRCVPCIALKKGVWSWVEGGAPPANYVEPIISGLSQGADADLKLLRTASLVMEPFPFEVASTAAGLSEEEADLSIDRLCRHGILEQAWGGKGEQYYIASPEIKEAVVRGLADRSKKRLHSRIVESLGRQADAGLQGRHQFEAQQGPDSLAHLTEGAGQLAERGAFSEASELWQLAHQVVQGIELPELRWRVELGTIESIWRSGHVEEALALAETVAELPAPTTPEALVHYQKIQGLRLRLAWLHGQDAEKIERLCAKLAIPPSAHSFWLQLTYAEVLDSLGSRAEALRVLDEMARYDPPPLFFLVRGKLLRALNRFKEAETALQEALLRPDFLSVDQLYSLRWESAECQIGLKNLAAALETIDAALTTCVAEQERDWEARFWGLRGRCCEAAEEWDEATQSFQDGVECSRGSNARLAETLVALGHHQIVRRQLPQAEATLREVLQGSQVERFTVQASLGLGIVCLLASRLDEAHEWLNQAVGEGAPAAGLLLQAEVARLQSNSAQVSELLEKVNAHLRPVTLELGMALTLKGLLGHPVDRGRVLELLIDAPSLTVGDSLRSIRTDWIERVRGMVPASLEPTRTPRPVKADDSKVVEAPLQVSNRLTNVIVTLPATSALKSEDKASEAAVKSAPTPSQSLTPQNKPAEPGAPPSPAAPGDPRSLAIKALIGVGIGGLLLTAFALTHRSTPIPSPSPSVIGLAPTLTPTPVAAALVLDSLPERSDIRLLGADGKEVASGSAPLTCPLSLAPGDYQARVSKSGFVPGQFDFHLDANLHSKTFTLEPISKIHLEFAKVPVTVKIDGEAPERITAPVWEKEIRAGQHKILVSAEGYEDKTLSVEVLSGKTADVPVIKLFEALASIDLETRPPSAKLFLDGALVGRTPEGASEKGSYRLSKLKPGQHEVKVSLSGYESLSSRVELAAGKNSPRVFTLHELPEVRAPRPLERPRPPHYDPPPRINPPPRHVVAPDSF